MKTQLLAFLPKLIVTLATFLVFAVPLFFLPLTSEFYLFNKFALIVFASVLLFFSWTLTFILRKSVRLTFSPLNVPLLVFALVTVVATLVASPSKTEAFLGQTTLVLALTALFFILSSTIKTLTHLKRFIAALELSGLILVVFAILSLVGVSEALYPLEFMRTSWWTPLGLPLILFLYLLTLLPTPLIRGLRTKSAVSLGIAALFVIGIVVSGSHLLPGKDTTPILLPFKAGWDISLETFKDSPFLGTGPGSFNETFTRARPIELNNHRLWNIRFGQSSNAYLNLVTTTGILGLASFLFLGLRIIKITSAAISKSESPESAAIASSLLVILATLLFVPFNTVLIFLFYTLAALFVAARKIAGHPSFSDATLSFYTFQQVETSSQKPPIPAAILPWLLFVPATLITVVVFTIGGRAYAAEVAFRSALVSLQENRGSDAYNQLIQTIRLNPGVDGYHRLYAQTNLALANALAGKDEPTDQERSDITQLIQQAIREAKTATRLNPINVVNWENLAQIYRSLINVAQGAENWTIASYLQAIRLDPTNPQLRILLGGVFYSLGDYENAQNQFSQAASLKPDLANAHYNLSAAFRDQGDTLSAVRAMETTLRLVPVDSNDSTKVQAELDELKKQLTQAQETQLLEEKRQQESETLTTPPPLPTPIAEPIELPEEAAPDVLPETEEATPPAAPSPGESP